MKCTDLLVQDHKIILRALDVLQVLAERTEEGVPVSAEDVETFVRFLRAFADDHHQGKEESALFPYLVATSGIDYPAVRHMVFEHNQERSLVEGLEEALHTNKGLEFVYFANRLTQLLRTHIEKEEGVMFDIAERSISAEQDKCITRELAAFRIDAQLLADLRRLEGKYLRRSACASGCA
jgi:hemerythrin-like domain-containing protein